MRLNPLIASPLAMSLLSILTGCHLCRVPSPALSMAARAMSAGGLLGTHLLIGSIECVPASIAIRALGKSVNHFSPPEGVVRNRPRSNVVTQRQGRLRLHLAQGAFFSDDAVSSQLFAICCFVVTYRRNSTLILQPDGQEAPLSEKRTGVSPKARTYVKVSSSTLVRAPTHVGVHAGRHAARGSAHRGRCVAPHDHTA
jgi:hypothetical protein